MSAEVLAGAAGVALALLFAYVPGLSTKYAALSKESKSLIMLGLLFLVAAVSVGIACAGWAGDLGISVTCDKSGFIAVGKALLAAIVSNQSVYMIAPQTAKVQAAKAGRG